MGMSTTTSMTLEMPAPPPPSAAATPAPAASTSSLSSSSTTTRRPLAKPSTSAIRNISSGLSASGKAPLHKHPPSKSAQTKLSSSGGATKDRKLSTSAKAGTKRKRGPKTEEGGDESSSSSSSSLSSISNLTGDGGGSSKEDGTASPPAPTMTKSGRQVQKPSTYNPATADQSSGKRRGGQPISKARTAEQALCKRCTRMHSPASNQMVFCDGCNDGWHQMCHEPWIEDDAVRDASRAWFCADCQARRDRHFAKRQKAAASSSAGTARESWAGKSAHQKRSYLSALPQSDLVALVMYVLDLHPDLAVFPPSDGTPPARSPRGEALPNTPASPGTPVRSKVSGGSGRSPASKARGQVPAANGGQAKDQKEDMAITVTGQEQDDDEDEDPLAPPWPQPGKGLYNMLPPDEDDDKHLVDDDDYEAFSVVIYDENGKKIEENGVKV